MKSKQELIKEWESAIEAAEFYGKGKEERLISYMKDFVSDLRQLDETETLSQEWIEGNSVYASSDGVTEEYVHVDDLQNLLVPKQEDAKVNKFKQGDILRNRWSGEKNPTRFFIVWKTYGKKVSVIELINNKLIFEKDSYTDVYELFHDGEPAFVKVGQTKAFELMRQDLKIFLQAEELEE